MTEAPYEIGKVVRVIEEKQIPSDDTTLFTQRLEVKSDKTNEVLEVAIGSEFQPITASQRLRTGTKVILSHQEIEGRTEYYVVDVYRLPIINWLFIGFVFLVLLVGRWRGLASLVGMGASLAVLVWFLIPRILEGADPVVSSLLAASGIATITIYLSHGFNLKSHLALGSLVITLLAVTALSAASVRAAQLVGLGSEEAYFVQLSSERFINIQGLLLGGIVLGALGVLDDIIISQISVVNQLFAANKKLSFPQLYNRALEVGKDHVASLVNTLALAYAGANLPLFLLFYNNSSSPFWVNLNSEVVLEEVVRTLVGSIGLVLAVPLSTVVAAFALYRSGRALSTDTHHSH